MVNQNFEYLEQQVQDASSKIYANNATLESKISTATTNTSNQITSLQQDVNNQIKDVNSNLSILSSKKYVETTYQNGTSWYRVWSDGWIEQGGLVTNIALTIQTITFLKPFKDANYYINCNQPLEISGSFQTFGIPERNADSFKVMQRNYNQDAGACDSVWYACGY